VCLALVAFTWVVAALLGHGARLDPMVIVVAAIGLAALEMTRLVG